MEDQDRVRAWRPSASGGGHGDAPAAADAAAAEVDAPSASRAAAIFFRSRVAGWRGQSVRVYTLMRAVRGGGEA